MAQGGATSTGVKEMRAALNELPRRVSTALRAVAWQTGRRVMEGAKQRLQSQIKHSVAPRTANWITMRADEANRQVVVTSAAPPGEPANLPLWLEHGTRKMAAKPYMGPSLRAESGQYVRESEQVSADAARQVLG